MSRPVLVRIHLAAAAGALAVISTFLVSSTVIELIGDPGEVRSLRHAILLALPLLIGCLAASALTGRRLAGRSGLRSCAASSGGCRWWRQSAWACSSRAR